MRHHPLLDQLRESSAQRHEAADGLVPNSYSVGAPPCRWSIGDRPPESSFLDPDPNFVQVPQQVRWVLIHPVSTRPLEFVLAVAPREKANAEGPPAAGGEEIPDPV